MKRDERVNHLKRETEMLPMKVDIWARPATRFSRGLTIQRKAHSTSEPFSSSVPLYAPLGSKCFSFFIYCPNYFAGFYMLLLPHSVALPPIALSCCDAPFISNFILKGQLRLGHWFSPNTHKQIRALWILDLPQVSSSHRGFPSHYDTLYALFLSIYLCNALRRFWMNNE